MEDIEQGKRHEEDKVKDITTSPVKGNDTSVAFEWGRFYSYKPFFTRQINEQTWLTQYNEWKSLVLRFCKHRRIFRLVASFETTQSAPFTNAEIKRTLPLECMLEIFGKMVNEGLAEWLEPQSEKVLLVYWRSLADWAEILYRWIVETGQQQSVLTFFEIQNCSNRDLAGIDSVILSKAAAILKNQERTEIMTDKFGVPSGLKAF